MIYTDSSFRRGELSQAWNGAGSTLLLLLLCAAVQAMVPQPDLVLSMELVADTPKTSSRYEQLANLPGQFNTRSYEPTESRQRRIFAYLRAACTQTSGPSVLLQTWQLDV